MARSESPATLRALVPLVAALALAASSLLLSAAQVGSPRVSGYGVDKAPPSSPEVASR
ncbi:MAG: hypothetical protein JWL86_4619 [Rhizobium sp.]|nr:hypothetical protein [Rhizobium sp.]